MTKYTTEDIFYFLDILETVLKEGEFSSKFDTPIFDTEKINTPNIDNSIDFLYIKDIYAEMAQKRRIAHEIDLVLLNHRIRNE